MNLCNWIKISIQKVTCILVLGLCALGGSSLTASAEQGVYVLNTSTPYAKPVGTRFQDFVVTEVFRRIGLRGTVQRYDVSARALANAIKIVDQGVAIRTKGLGKIP